MTNLEQVIDDIASRPEMVGLAHAKTLLAEVTRLTDELAEKEVLALGAVKIITEAGRKAAIVQRIEGLSAAASIMLEDPPEERLQKINNLVAAAQDELLKVPEHG